MRLEKICEVKPEIHYISQYDPKSNEAWSGIKAIWYEGTEYLGKRTKVFAYIGYPKMAKDKKVPAIVLVHGGDGHAYAEWVRLWNEKGFAAIAMDTTGYFPYREWKGLVGTEEGPGEAAKYKRELCDDLLEEGYTVGPDNSAMKDCNLPLNDQWMYHAVADTILAHNILLNDSRIDSEKIGISGISWGGVISSIAIGYDNRYAFAIPIYGSAYLDYLPAPKIPRVFGEPLVKKLWSAAERLKNVDFPVLWLCYCEDTCFSFGANSLSYQATKKSQSFLSVKFGMKHSHVRGWSAQEGYRFAERITNAQLPLIRAVTEPSDFGQVSFEIVIPEDFEKVSADIFYLTEPATYNDKNQLTNEWKCVKADIQEGTVSGIVPEEAYGYFVELKGFIEETSYISTTAWVEK